MNFDSDVYLGLVGYSKLIPKYNFDSDSEEDEVISKIGRNPVFFSYFQIQLDMAQ